VNQEITTTTETENLVQIVEQFKELQKSETGLKVLTAKSLGLNPFEALTGINIIQGKPSMSSALQNKILRREGWDLTIEKDIDNQEVRIIGKNERLKQTHSVLKSYEWAMNQSFFRDSQGKPKGLWRTDPLTMLTWRAISEFYRLYSEAPAIYETTELKESIEPVEATINIDELEPVEIQDSQEPKPDSKKGKK